MVSHQNKPERYLYASLTLLDFSYCSHCMSMLCYDGGLAATVIIKIIKKKKDSDARPSTIFFSKSS